MGNEHCVARKTTDEGAWSDEEEPWAHSTPVWSIKENSREKNSEAVPESGPVRPRRRSVPQILSGNPDPTDERHPQHQQTFFKFLKSVWAADSDSVPRYPVLQSWNVGQEAIKCNAQFTRGEAQYNWSVVHKASFGRRRNSESSCARPIPEQLTDIEEHWLDREYSEHVTAALGHALFQMMSSPDRSHGERPQDPSYTPFFDLDYPYRRMDAKSLLETIRARLPMSSEILIIAMWYFDMLTLKNPTFDRCDSDCLNTVLIMCSLVASKVYDAGVRMLEFGEHNQCWASTFEIPIARINQLETLLIQLLEWNIRMPLSTFVTYRYEISRGSLLRGLIEVVGERPDIGDNTSVVQIEVTKGTYREEGSDEVGFAGDSRDTRRQCFGC